MWCNALCLRNAPVSGLTFRAVRDHEVALAAEQNITAFGGDLGDLGAVEQRFAAHREHGELWGVEADGLLVGHCRLLRVEHFFGGRAVACMDVAGVAVPQQHRRKGVASALMEAAVAWGTHEGLGLSLLFPGATALYRKLGWEHAGTFPRYRLDTPLANASGEPMRTAGADDWPAIQACHDAFVPTLNGSSRRTSWRWATLHAAERRYVLDGARGVDAYVLVYRGADPTEGLRAAPSVDWAAANPRGLRAVVALLASGVLGPSATLHAPTASFWSPWADSWAVAEAGGLFWMARGLHLPNAVASRGFPRGIEGAVTIAVDDRVVIESQGPWRLEVAGGQGSLSPAADADVIVDARAIGPLFTGFRTATELVAAGLLDGSLPAVELLDAMFAGSAPVALDFF